jgi:rhodanese-related sulfurtransferase
MMMGIRFSTTLFFIGVLFVSSALAVDLPFKQDGTYVSPESVDGAETIDAAQAHDLWKQRAWFVDVRKEGQYESGRIPGALNLPFAPGKTGDQPFNSTALEAEVAKDEALVIYCNAESCDRSSWGAALATQWGWKKVYYFRKGFPAWSTAGYPVE